ncbi:MAG TPA: hypothetical protein VFZ89_18385 [Solirubrobacteraceae bacterium]
MHEPIRQHLAAIATRRDVDRLLGAASADDHTQPYALEWVRRWGPIRAGASLPDCSCDAGRCVVCN